ncbi:MULTISPECIES: hypothetical protein [Halolamina]|uniref:Uncharacterized protein n=1 Tax=Halolamina pelagica TaxID=699431 RepID=A0A1I5SM60_9EURY|nr:MULTISPECIES: hypothetical protein [Halolamina]NHX36994.1 hypothetical protein [Halolamina sp. R1-12]SFP71731.1 hypothetical protein SAMN05216277_106186 [Halolamina pelagica]
MDIQPTERTGRKIVVKLFRRRSVERVDVQSIDDAIATVKAETADEAKILQDDEVVYYTERNGAIEDWERAWEHEKRRLSAEESAWDCPHGVEYCYEDDRCIDCQIDRAAGNVSDESPVGRGE